MREIYKACLKLIPHKQFTFAKVWTQYAMFEVRQLDLDAARKILGTAIGLCPKEAVSLPLHLSRVLEIDVIVLVDPTAV